MVSTSKILTVSYGTFSCTLEGFDDSFETMKAIAEYFRDLAAEDRYFGAEPPVPDAEMLARIAEREIARRVEAREERGNIVLRAQPYGTVGAPLAQPVATSQPVAASQPVSFAPAPLAQTPAAAAPAAAAPAPAQQPVAAERVAETATENVAETATETTAETVAAPAVAPRQAPTRPAADVPTADVPAADDWEDVSLDAFASDVARSPAMATTPLRHTPVPHPDPESVAAKLQRIRDVVTKAAATPAPDSYSEDEHADSFLAETASSIETALAEDAAADQHPEDDDGDEIAALLSRLTGESKPAAAQAAAADAIAQDDAFADEGFDDEGFDGDLAADDLAADDLAADALPDQPPAAAALAQDAPQQDTEQQPEDDRIGDALRADWATIETGMADTVADAAQADQQDDDDLVDIEIAADDATGDEANGTTPSVRVIKMKRADFEAALAAGELVPEDDADADAGDTLDNTAQVADDRAEAAAVTQAAPTSGLRILPGAGLSPQEEEDLRRELAAVEAELVDIYRDTEDHADPRASDMIEDEDDDLTSLFDEDEDDAQDKVAAQDAAPLVLRDPREQLVNVRAEDDMSRLMAKAESAMTEPESASRRNAIAHLRAAVAATKAEQSAGTLPTREPAANAFRDDLASVVRPRRPMGEAATATPRPADARPAPLKLVAEQRVDLQNDRAATPVRPRRVSLAPMPDDAADLGPIPSAPDTAVGEFADFARKMGATALPDLLEAAAAYLVHVEAQPEFSRPQLMNKARQGTPDALSREDGLRAFGQLLRQGKIQKIRGGRFTAAEDIGFKPAARRAG
ncbi:MAG: hypothetical protein B7X55_03875 [Rhodobacterales bacterium 34-62-10]|nr:MAG: hypothetical protein B7X55_03875 [Rhodobacterales bacterium 34-62-10]